MTKAQIKKSKMFSPGLIGGSIVHFLASEKNLFFMKHDGQDEYLKDNSGKYVKMPIDEVIDARLSYVTSYADNEKKEAIERELAKMHCALEEKANKIISVISKNESYVNDNYGVLERAIIQLEPNLHKKYKKEASDFFDNHPTAIEDKVHLMNLLETKDYEGLHQAIDFEFGKPMASFKNGDGVDLTALKNVIGRENVEQSLTELRDKGPLYFIAKCAVEKRYHPE